MTSAQTFRIGIDENGLGARLGPLVVTGVLARVTDKGSRLVSRKPPKRLRDDLGDSKELVSHGDIALGEAWARAVVGPHARTTQDLVRALAFEEMSHLTAECPSHVEAQCWAESTATFIAEEADVRRVTGHLAFWAERGIEVVSARSSIVCTKRLNAARAAGGNRFISDLHAMERLVLGFRKTADADVLAVCGKVGGMDDYGKFFGPLSQSHGLHAEICRGKAKSAYHFPRVGEVRFVRDADAADCLVMLASIVGKYMREILMGRIVGHYAAETGLDSVSGYHDPVTARFVEATSLMRKKRKVPNECFERARPGE